MTYVKETQEQKKNRIWKGRIFAFLAVTWWVVSVGGIIYVVEATT